jgi:pimeloyl-ACP methyl ester carboxylesterase
MVAQFDGEVVDVTGDESLSVFPSALRAVDCALALQGALRSFSDLRLRIGIHLGDVLRHDGEVVGEGVNVAARVRPLAEPGGIVVSEPVYQMIRTRAHVTADALGPQNFKNVAGPMGVYALHSADEPAAPRPVDRGRRGLLIGATVALAILAGLLIANRTNVLASIALWYPKLFSSAIDQNLGMTTTEDGVRVAYASTGEGPPVLSVLGWATHLEDGLGSAVYDPSALLPMTSKRHRLVRFDGRGFGLSDRDVLDFSIEARVRDIEAVVAATGLDRFAIYAQSAGGPAAIAYTARNPERVTQLVLASSMASAAFLTDERRLIFERTLDLVETNLGTPAVSNMFVEVLLQDGGGSNVQQRIFAEFIRRSANGQQLAAFMREQIKIDVRDEARRIQVPTLVIHARDDQTVDLAAGREMAALIDGARFEIVDGGHVEGTGNSVATRLQILDFLAE